MKIHQSEKEIARWSKSYERGDGNGYIQRANGGARIRVRRDSLSNFFHVYPHPPFTATGLEYGDEWQADA